jgi:plasmid maintenance system antidote protein VapI
MDTAYDPDWVIKPGETIQDYIDEMGGSVDALAGAAGLSVSELQGVIDGAPLTSAIADCLYGATGISAQFWLTLEERYREGLAEGKVEL